jgi:Ca2+:H+ antiporter
MKIKLELPVWTVIVPLLAWLLYAGVAFQLAGFYSVLLAFGLIGTVMAAVNAGVIKNKNGG